MDGIAIIIRIIAGDSVQRISIFCLSLKFTK